MELKLDVYKTRLCREKEKTVTAKDFDLSTGVCEDVLNVINIDMFEGGLQSLTDESKNELIMQVIKNGYPFFVELIKDIFEITDDEAKRLKVADIAKVVMDIVKYSITQLTGALGGKQKN